MTSQDVLIDVDSASKKFCRDLKKSLYYGLRDFGRELTGKDRTTNLRRDEFWALDGASFQVNRGEILGVIGPNGSGKTTLLRMLTGLIYPDKGQISITGRVGALIQLGAGFSPVLSGRENIKINGAVLGIPTAEIERRLDEIIAFAEIGEFIDSPVRTYSSGMRARLGFAVAISLTPDVLLIDEVLAVGDLKFRTKAMDKMTELTKSGCAVVFVSHNIGYIERICDRALYLNKGKQRAIGPTREIIQEYAFEQTDRTTRLAHWPGTADFFTLHEAVFEGPDADDPTKIVTGQSMRIKLDLTAKHDIENPHFTLIFLPTDRMVNIAHVQQGTDASARFSLTEGKNHVEIEIDHMPFLAGQYRIQLSVYEGTLRQVIGKVTEIGIFSVEASDETFPATASATLIDANWKVISEEPDTAVAETNTQAAQ